MVRCDGREESERFLSWDSLSDFKCWWLNLPAQCIYSLITLSATMGCVCPALCHVQDDNPFFCKGEWAWEEHQLKGATYCCVLGADIPTNLAPTKLQHAGRVLLVNGCKSSSPQAEMYHLIKFPGTFWLVQCFGVFFFLLIFFLPPCWSCGCPRYSQTSGGGSLRGLQLPPSPFLG